MPVRDILSVNEVGGRMRETLWFIGAGVVTVVAVVLGLQHPTLLLAIVGAVAAVVGYLMVPLRLVLGVSVSAAVATVALVPGLTQSSGPAQFTAAAVSGALVTISMWRVRRLRRPNTYIGLIVIFYALATVATFANPLANWFYISTVLVALPVAFASRDMTEDERKVVHRTVIGLGIALALVGIAETFIFNRLLFSEPTVGVSASAFFDLVRAQATAGTALILGFLLCIAFLLLISTPGPRFPKFIACVILVIGVIATGSASIFAVLIVGFLVVVFFRSRSGTRVCLVLFGGSAAILSAWAGWVPAEVTSQFTGINITQRANSLASLPRILNNQDISQAFFGNGWGGAELLYNSGVLIESRSHSVDNQIVTTLIETGILGLLLLALAVLSALRKSRPEYRAIIFSVVLLFASFDVLLWALPATLLMFLASAPAPAPLVVSRDVSLVGHNESVVRTQHVRIESTK